MAPKIRHTHVVTSMPTPLKSAPHTFLVVKRDAPTVQLLTWRSIRVPYDALRSAGSDISVRRLAAKRVRHSGGRGCVVRRADGRQTERATRSARAVRISPALGGGMEPKQQVVMAKSVQHAMRANVARRLTADVCASETDQSATAP